MRHSLPDVVPGRADAATGLPGEVAAADAVAWERLRAAAGRCAGWLRSPLSAGPGCCAVCRGAAGPGFRRCFQCAVHRQLAPGLLADVVVPISYSVAGTEYAQALWHYKADVPGRDEAGRLLRDLLLVFLHDHGRCAWARAGGGPTHVAVVPGGRGRPGIHPLRVLLEPYLALPWTDLGIDTGEPVQARDLRPGRFRAAGPLGGARVLLLDDTWTSGSSAQSAALALKLAGAKTVVAVVLGRHLNPADAAADPVTALLAARPFRPGICAVHAAARRSHQPPVLTESNQDTVS